MGIGATKHNRTDNESHRKREKHGFHDATARTRDFYERTKEREAIIRNNRGYLLGKIQTYVGVGDSLSLGKCITAEQYLLLEYHRTQQFKKTELLHAMWSIDDKKFPEFLRGIGQQTVTRIIRNGGVVIKGIVKNCGETRAMFVDPHLLYQRMNDIRNRNNKRADQTDQITSQLNEEDIEILNTQLDGRTVVVWIWCQSQQALENIQMLYESNQLADVLFGFQNIRQSASEVFHSNVISIDSNKFRKTVVVCPISNNFAGKKEIMRTEKQSGVALLRNEIYVLAEWKYYVASDSLSLSVIRVFEDRFPFGLRKEIQVKAINSPFDIGSSEKDNCLYVSDFEENYVWKIIKETDDQHKIILWLTTDFQPRTLSVSSNGHLLMADYFKSILNIYGSDAKLIRSIQLPADIRYPRHAVETSTGSLIILSECVEPDSLRRFGCVHETFRRCVINELTRDGQMVIHRFNPSNRTNEELNNAEYLSLDSEDRVSVADYGKSRVILLNSDLKWNRILCPTEAADNVQCPWRLCYHESQEQLFVVGCNNNMFPEVTVQKAGRRNRGKSSNEDKSGIPYWFIKDGHPKIAILRKDRPSWVVRKTSCFSF